MCPTGGTEHRPVFQPSWFHGMKHSLGRRLKVGIAGVCGWKLGRKMAGFILVGGFRVQSQGK